eukprot:SM000025S08326  [mRNA]  locus=s25:95751:99235:+ [translate_table: standard]
MRSPWSSFGGPASRINPLHAPAAGSGDGGGGAQRDTASAAAAATAAAAAAAAAGRPVQRWQLFPARPAVESRAPVPHYAEDVRIGIEEDEGLLGAPVFSGLLERMLPPAPAARRRRSRRRRPPPTAALPRELLHAHLTDRELALAGGERLALADVVAVTRWVGSRRLTVHALPPAAAAAMTVAAWQPWPWRSAARVRRDLALRAPTIAEAELWGLAFAGQGCFVHELPADPLLDSGDVADNLPLPASPALGTGSGTWQPPLRRRRVLVVANPKSGNGRALHLYQRDVQPILEVPRLSLLHAAPSEHPRLAAVLVLGGFDCTLVETLNAGHARKVAAAMDLSACPDGIVCVGGDGIVNEVVNGLLARKDAGSLLPVPIGIVPAGSDNSLAWSVLGIRDPLSAALAIVKGGTIAVDTLLVQAGRAGSAHAGLCIAYFGFMSDVLELATQYQARFGPLRYAVAGAVKILQLPCYRMDIEFLPLVEEEEAEEAKLPLRPPPPSNGRTQAASRELLQKRPSEWSVAGMSGVAQAHKLDRSAAGILSGDCGDWSARRALDELDLAMPQAIGRLPRQRSSTGTAALSASRSMLDQPALWRNGGLELASAAAEQQQQHHPPGRRRTSPPPEPELETVPSQRRSRGRAARRVGEWQELENGCRGTAAAAAASSRREPRWYSLPGFSPCFHPDGFSAVQGSDDEDAGRSVVPPLTLPAPPPPPPPPSSAAEAGPQQPDAGRKGGGRQSFAALLGTCFSVPTSKLPAKTAVATAGAGAGGWVLRRGPFLAVMTCNHRCRSVQCLSSQSLAPHAAPGDGSVDLILVRPVGRLRLLAFLGLMQFSRHLALPYVEYCKVRAVRVIPLDDRHRACGIDGELLPLEEPASVMVMPGHCRLIGRPQTQAR